MKRLTTLIIGLMLTGALVAQDFVEVSYGPSYSRHDFYTLETDEIQNFSNTSWDIALTAFGNQDAGIHINEATASMGTGVELYLGPSPDFDDPVSVDDLVILLYNDDKSWEYGAFNSLRDEGNPLDLGWGDYDPANMKVEGREVFVIKLRNGQYKKIQITDLTGTTYNMKWADLDGSNEVQFSVNKSDYPNADLILINVGQASVVDAVQPFDLLFTRYISPLDDGNGGFLDYAVTGVLHGHNIEVARAAGVDPETVTFEEFQDSLKSRIDVINFDWKEIDLGTFSWIVYEDRVYFVKDRQSKIWKIQFIDFEGSSTGNTIFTKEDLGVISAVNNIKGLEGFKVTPNPASDVCHLILDITEAMNLDLNIYDLNGRLVIHQDLNLNQGFVNVAIDIDHLIAGQYIISLSSERGVTTSKLIVR